VKLQAKSRKNLDWDEPLGTSACFATDKHIITMNLQWRHVLRRPNLQDLRRLKVYKITCSGKILQLNECTNICEQPRKANVFGDVYPVMSTFGESSSCSEAWLASLPSLLLSPESSFPVSLDSSSSVDDSGGAVSIPRLSSSIN
jgi:hypothetical protein